MTRETGHGRWGKVSGPKPWGQRGQQGPCEACTKCWGQLEDSLVLLCRVRKGLGVMVAIPASLVIGAHCWALGLTKEWANLGQTGLLGVEDQPSLGAGAQLTSTSPHRGQASSRVWWSL